MSADTNFSIRAQVTVKAHDILLTLDKGFVGTRDYMGLAYFWAYEYRHTLRDATARQRKIVHDRWLKAGLDLLGVSDEHDRILRVVCKENN